VQYEIRDPAPQGGKPWIIEAAYVRAGEPMPLPLKTGNFIKGKHHKITWFYDSVSGNRYESVIELNGDEIENFAFSRRGSAQRDLRNPPGRRSCFDARESPKGIRKVAGGVTPRGTGLRGGC
jgi:hypothetical protein